jgi:catechol 2,3-dioxygenase-like lactoylglutathione lyase family enzyme
VLRDRDFHASIPAKDLARTRRFYEDVLGLSVEREVPAGITYRAGNTTFDLYETQYAGSAQHTLGGFLVDDIEAEVSDLGSSGVVFEDYDFPGLRTVNGIADLGGERSAWFKDPEGNILALFQPVDLPS